MNLISCGNCGVVIDASKLEFPDDIYDEDGTVIPSLCMWDDKGNIIPKVLCPVCGADIGKPD